MELRFTERHVTALNFGLVALLAYFAAASANDVIARTLSTSAAPTVEADAPAPSDTRPKPRAQYEQIVRRDVFNLIPQTPGKAAADEDLNVKLLGTSQLSMAKPYAIIEDHSGTQDLYRLGDEIPDAGTLVGVERSRAIIERDGRRVAIEISTELPPPSSSGSAASSSPNRSRMDPDRAAKIREFLKRRGSARGPLPATRRMRVQPMGRNRFGVNRDDAAATLASPGELGGDVQANPVTQDGKPSGYSLSQIAPGSVYEQLGLQNGDVVTAVDDHPIGNPMQALTRLNSLQKGSSVQVQVIRNGSPMTLQLELQ